MSVLIKGMEMPESCFQCPFRQKINPDDIYCYASGEQIEETFAMIKGRYADCPLVEVQDECDGDSCPIHFPDEPKYDPAEFFSAERGDGR